MPITADTKIAPLKVEARINDYDLNNVTPDQVRTILRGVRNGKLDMQERLFRLMVDSWPRLRKAMNEIGGAVAKLPIEIHPAKKADMDEPTPRAQKICDVVKRAFESYAPKPQAIELDTQGMTKALIDAYAKGFSVLEIVWQQSGGIISPRAYVPIPARYISYPQGMAETDRLMLSPKGTTSNLVDFPEDQFLIGIWNLGGVHPIYGANLRSLSKHWLAAVYGLGWLMQYAQLFGTPTRHIETDGTAGAMAAAELLLQTIGANGYAVTGPGVKINTAEGATGSASTLPQSVLQEIADRACDILLLGQTLTTDNTGTGSRALGEVHDGIRTEYIRSISSWVAGILTTQLIPAIVRLNFGAIASEDMPYATITVPEVKDQKAITERVKMILEMGVPVTEKWVYETLEIPEPQDGNELFGDDEGADEPDAPNVPEAEDEYDDLDLTPSEEMAQSAMKALDAKRNKGDKERGMGSAYVMRARDIVDRVRMEPETIKAMALFFSQVEASNQDGWKEKGKRWQEYHALGGDAGKAWVMERIAKLK